MKYFVYTAIAVLAASASKSKVNDSQTSKEPRNLLSDEKVVAGKAG